MDLATQIHPVVKGHTHNSTSKSVQWGGAQAKAAFVPLDPWYGSRLDPGHHNLNAGNTKLEMRADTERNPVNTAVLVGQKRDDGGVAWGWGREGYPGRSRPFLPLFPFLDEAAAIRRLVSGSRLVFVFSWS